MATVGELIAGARTKAKLTQKELADRVGVKRSWIASVETGGTGQPGPDKLKLIANEIGLDIRQLLAMTDQLGAQIGPTQPGIAELIASNAALIAMLQEQNKRISERADRQERLIEALVNLSGMEIVKGQEVAKMVGEIRAHLIPGDTRTEPPPGSSGSSTRSVPRPSAGRK